MARNSEADTEWNEILSSLLGSRSHPKPGSQSDDPISAALSEALSEALTHAISQASPLERALFAEALAPALAEALAPALADALVPALATALGNLATAKAKKPAQPTHDGEAGEGTRRPERK